MDAIQRQLIFCLAAYRTGAGRAQLAEGLTGGDWSALYRLASIHKMEGIVYETLWSEPAFCLGDEALKQRWKQLTLLQAVGQAAKTQRIADLSALLRSSGIPHALVKGALCRELYSRPDVRLSGDEDLYIAPADQETVFSLLEGEGLQRLADMDGDDVTHWTDPGTGLHIELHNRLLTGGRPEEAALNAEFEAQLAHRVTVPITGGEVDTLPPTWHFAFLVFHALRHFLAGGFGVRTLCDVVTFAERWSEQIDWPCVLSLLERMNARVFLDQIFAVGREHLAFDPAAIGWHFAAPPEPEELLLDCLEAGVYGQSTMARRHSAGIVVRAAEENTGTASGLLGTLFPNRKSLEGRYPELREHPALLPVCWLKRLWRYAREVCGGREGNSPLEAVALGRKRTEMMVKYGVFPKDQEKT